MKEDNENNNITQVLPLGLEDSYLHEIDNIDHTLQHKTLLMGILNITPDSFSDGGKWINNNDKHIFS